MKIGYGKQEINDNDIAAVVETLKSDYLTQGPKIEEFENSVAMYHGAKYAVAFSNGTAALHGCYNVLNVCSNDEIITSAITFAASSNAAVYQGATPIFCDITSETNCMSLEEVKKAVNSKTKVVCPVSFTGLPYDLKSLREIVGDDIYIVHDAAHAIGSKRDGTFGLEYADLAILSFHPVKHITTGEGGMVLTNNKSLYEKLLQFRTHGITKDASKLKKKCDGPWYHEMQYLGYNYRMCDIQAALGLEQFKRIEKNIYNRNLIASKYNEELKDIEWIETPPHFDLNWTETGEIPVDVHSYHLYTIQVDKDIRKKFFEYLHSCGIFVQVHYIPVYKHPYYEEKFDTSTLFLENAENYYARTISLPMFHSMTDEEFKYIIEKIKLFKS